MFCALTTILEGTVRRTRGIRINSLINHAGWPPVAYLFCRHCNFGEFITDNWKTSPQRRKERKGRKGLKAINNSPDSVFHIWNIKIQEHSELNA
jgi:hypothetical protein